LAVCREKDEASTIKTTFAPLEAVSDQIRATTIPELHRSGARAVPTFLDPLMACHLVRA